MATPPSTILGSPASAWRRNLLIWLARKCVHADSHHPQSWFISKITTPYSSSLKRERGMFRLHEQLVISYALMTGRFSEAAAQEEVVGLQ